MKKPHWKSPQKHKFQLKYGGVVKWTIVDIAFFLDRNETAISWALRSIPKGTALTAEDVPMKNGANGSDAEGSNPALAREIAHRGTYLPFKRWGEIMGIKE